MRAERLLRRTLVRLAGAALLVAASTIGPSTPGLPFAPAACLAGVGPYAGSTPWPQKLFDAADLGAIGDGQGQLVAVLGSGVDINNSQFRPGQLTDGHDILGGGDPHADCDGRGTFAAGLVGAQPEQQTSFAGLAPGVRIDPIRYVQTFENNDSAAPDPALLAQSIDAAIGDHATVILVVVPAAVDPDGAVKAATQRAIAHNIVVVSPAAAGDAGAQSFPTAYPGVLGVGAVDINGAVLQTEVGPWIGLTAPGGGLVSTAPGSGVENSKPTNLPSMSAAFVAAAAALVRAADPRFDAAQVITRLELTADRAAPSERTDQTGWGTVNPYAALTTDLPATASLPTAPARPSASRIEAQPAPSAAPAHSRTAALIAVGVLLLSVLVAAGAAATRTARERRRQASA